MAEGTQNAELVFEPVYVGEKLIIIPMSPVPQKPAPAPAPSPVPYEKKRLVVNIETTGFDPFLDRIIAIGVQDPNDYEANPLIIMFDDERQILDLLFTIIVEGSYEEIIGYGLSFDFRFIMVRAMYHGLTCKEFYDMTLYDLMQGMAQGKFSFVYFPQKAVKLSDVGEFFWGFPKPFTDLKMLEYYELGQLDKVSEFTSSQVMRILALYYLFRYINETPVRSMSSEVGGFDLSLGQSLTGNPRSKLTIPEANAPKTWIAHCPVCLSEFDVPMDLTEFICPIDGAIIKRS